MKMEDLINSTGIKALYDMTMADTDKIAELKRQEDNNLPIDLDMAREVVSHMDIYMDGLATMSWSNRMMLQQGKFKKIQKEAHKHLEILEEKAKTQGIVIHNAEQPIKEPTMEPESQIEPKVQNDIPKVTEVTPNINPTTEVKKEVEKVMEQPEPLESLKGIIQDYQSIVKPKDDFLPIGQDEYIAITGVWNESIKNAAIRAYNLAQEELMDKLASSYEGFGGLKEEIKTEATTS